MTKHYYFSGSWKITWASALFLPFLIYLGFWQLSRGEEKQQILEQFNHTMTAKPVALVDINSTIPWQPYQKVALRGSYDHTKTFYLDNQISNNQVGFDVITPFIIGDGQIVLINRGFVPRMRDYNLLPSVPNPEQQNISLTGYIYIPQGEPFLLGQSQDHSSSWPKVVQSAQVNQLSSSLAGSVFPYIVRLDEDQLGVLKRHWKISNMGPEKHQAYAFQWFTMALVLFGLWLAASFSKIKQPQ